MKIYTRTGDKGQTSLFGGKRVLKDSLRVEAIGSVDELNSIIGIIVSENQKSKIKSQKYNAKLKKELVEIQRDLFELGSLLADPKTNPYTLTPIPYKNRVKEFEKFIDKMTKELPELQKFILPGGGKVGSLLHFARTVCRRAERRLVALSTKEKVDPSILVYLNRLSDLLFTMARFVNHTEKQKEIIWKK